MDDPFKITGPAVVSFSGGRTSGYMLWRILESHGGKLPDDVKVVFCNTGKERLETLDFVERCSLAWECPVVWLEYRFLREEGTKTVNGREKPAGSAGFEEVNYATASRNGEPFESLVVQRNFLPNPVTRFCTIDLKIRPVQKYVKALGWDDYDMVIGFRADEPRRVKKARNQNRDGYEREFPLFDAGVTESEILTFWKSRPYDLKLQSYEGNCDLCFLKGSGKIQRILRDKPALGDWWIDMESRIQGGHSGTGRFRNDRPGYAGLLQLSQRPTLFNIEEEEDELGIACHCTD